MQLLNYPFTILLFCASLVACHLKIARETPLSLKRRSNSPRVSSQDINWSSFFVLLRSHPSDVTFPDAIRHNDVASLYSHLSQYRGDQLNYNSICDRLDGTAFRSIFSYVLQEDDPETIASRKKVLLSSACISRIPDYNWSMATKRLAQLTDIGLHSLPPKSIAQLTPKVFQILLHKFHARQKQLGHSYSKWSAHLTKAHLDQDNWTGGMWHLLTPETISAIEKPKVQQAAISIVVGQSLRIPDGGYGIRESEIVDFGLRLVRLKSIQKHLQRTYSNKGIIEYIEANAAIKQNEASVLLKRNIEVSKGKPKSIKRDRRIQMLSLISCLSKTGSSSKEALEIVKDYMKYYGTDMKAAVTWEILAKFIVLNTDGPVVKYVASIIDEFSTENLPIDAVVVEACQSGAVKVLLAIIQNCHCAEMTSRIASIVDCYKQNLGYHYSMIKDAIDE